MMTDRISLFDEGLSIDKCFDRVKTLFFNENTLGNTNSLNLDYLDELLALLHEPNRPIDVVKRIALFVRDVAMNHPHACDLLLIHLPDLSDPAPFIDTLASMFISTSPALVADAFKQLRKLPERDSRLLLPVIGTMADLPLPADQLLELYHLAEEAIDRVEESELPALFRTLLKSLCPLRAERALAKFRNEMVHISDSSVALLVEVMWEVLPSSSGSAEVLLEQIVRDQEAHPLRQPSLTDLAIVLILTSNIGGLKYRARSLFRVWLMSGTFPFSHLEHVLSLRRSNELWERMVPAVWRICLWTLEALTDSSSPLRGNGLPHSIEGGYDRWSSGSNRGSDRVIYLSNKEGLARTILQLCDSMPSMRETVVSSLLARCYTGDDTNSSSYSYCEDHSNGVNSGGIESERTCAWLLNTRPLGHAAAEYNVISADDTYDTHTHSTHNTHGTQNMSSYLPHRNNSSYQSRNGGHGAGPGGTGVGPGVGPHDDRAAMRLRLLQHNKRAKHLRNVHKSLQRQALLAASVLQYMVRAHPEIGASVLSSIMDRLTPSSPSQGGSVTLPPAAILHCLVSCIVSVTATSPQIENTVHIVIQKLLAGAQIRGVDGIESSLLPVLATPNYMPIHRSNNHSNHCYHSNHHNSNNYSNYNTIDNSSLHTAYTPGTVGCFLSGHLLARTPPLNCTEFRSVLTLLSRAFDCFKDISVACTLDILVTCLVALKNQKKRKRRRRHSTVTNSQNNCTNSNRNNDNNNNDNNNNNNDNDNRGNEDENVKNNLLLAASESVFSKVIQYKALVLPASAYNVSDRTEETFAADIFDIYRDKYLHNCTITGDFVTTINTRNSAPSTHTTHTASSSHPSHPSHSSRHSPFSQPLTWNICELSGNLLSTTSNNRDRRDLERIKSETATLITTVFWVVQRSAALHSSLLSIYEDYGGADNNARNRNNANNANNANNSSSGKNNEKGASNNNNDNNTTTNNDRRNVTNAYVSAVCVLLSRSELDIAEKVPWMAGNVPGGNYTTTRERNSKHGGNGGSGNSSSNMKGSGKDGPDGGRSSRNSNKTTTDTPSSSASSSSSSSSSSDASPGCLCVWACGAVDGIESLTFTRSLSLSCADSLRLAWERVLTASVLLGYCSDEPVDGPLLPSELDSSLLLSKLPQDGVRELLVISRLLCQTHMARFMLRSAHAGSTVQGPSGGVNRKGGDGNKTQKRKNDDRERNARSMERGERGERGERSYSDLDRVGGNDNNNYSNGYNNNDSSSNRKDYLHALKTSDIAAERQVLMLSVQKNVLHGLTHRIEGLIKGEALLMAVGALLGATHHSIPPLLSVSSHSNHSTTSIGRTHTPTSLPPLSLPQSSPPSQSPSLCLLTDAGLAVLSCFALRVLTGQLPVTSLEPPRGDPNSGLGGDPRGDSYFSSSSSSVGSSLGAVGGVVGDMKNGLQGVSGANNGVVNSDELFYTLEEVTGGGTVLSSTAPSSASSSSSFSSSSSSSSSHHPSNDIPPANLDASLLLSSLLSLIPLLNAQEEALRRASDVSTSFLSSPSLTNTRPFNSSSSSSLTNNNRNNQSNQPAFNGINSGTIYQTEPQVNNQMNNDTVDVHSNVHGSVHSDENGNVSSLYGMMGGSLDRTGCAVLLLVLYSLLWLAAGRVRRNAGGDVMLMADDEYLQGVVRGMVQCLAVMSRGGGSSADESVRGVRGGGDGDEGRDGGKGHEQTSRPCILMLYDIIERQTLDMQDVSLAVSGVRLLGTLTEGSKLSSRGSSVAWMLLLTLHTQHTSLSSHLLDGMEGMVGRDGIGGGRGRMGRGNNGGTYGLGFGGEDGNVPGTDPLWPYLASDEVTSVCPSLDLALYQIEHWSTDSTATSGNKSVKAAMTSFRTAIGVSQKNNDSPKPNSVQSFRAFWVSWWVAEEAENRVYGVVNLLSEMFRCHLLPSTDRAESRNNDRSGGKGINDSSNSRNSRNSRSNGRINERDRGRSADRGGERGDGRGTRSKSLSKGGKSSTFVEMSSSFHSLTPENLESLFSLAIGMFPSLFLFTRPLPQRSHRPHHPHHSDFSSFSSQDTSSYYRKHSSREHFKINYRERSSDLNPFRSLISVIKSFIWLLQEVEEIVADGTQMKFVLRTSIMTVRTSRAVLLCLEGAVAACVAWRNRQAVIPAEGQGPGGSAGGRRKRKTARGEVSVQNMGGRAGRRHTDIGHTDQRHTDRGDSEEGSVCSDDNDRDDDDSDSALDSRNDSGIDHNGNDSDNDSNNSNNSNNNGRNKSKNKHNTVSNYNDTDTDTDTPDSDHNADANPDADPDSDPGSVEHLAVALDWALALSHRVIRYSESLKGRMLHPRSGLQVPRELVRATPQLQFQAERLAARLLRSAKAHSLQLREPEELFVPLEKNGETGSSNNNRRNINNNYDFKNNKNNNNNNDSNNSNNNKKNKKAEPIHWDDTIKRKSSQFSLYHKNIISKIPDDESWVPVERGAGSHYGRDEEENQNDSDKNVGYRNNGNNDNNSNISNNGRYGVDDDNRHHNEFSRGSNNDYMNNNRRDKRDSHSSPQYLGDDGNRNDEDDDEEDGGEGGFSARIKGVKTTAGWGLYQFDEGEDEEESESESDRGGDADHDNGGGDSDDGGYHEGGYRDDGYNNRDYDDNDYGDGDSGSESDESVIEEIRGNKIPAKPTQSAHSARTAQPVQAAQTSRSKSSNPSEKSSLTQGKSQGKNRSLPLEADVSMHKKQKTAARADVRTQAGTHDNYYVNNNNNNNTEYADNRRNDRTNSDSATQGRKRSEKGGSNSMLSLPPPYPK